MFPDLPPRLSDDEFRYYFDKYKSTGLDEYREKLIVHNLRLVLIEAHSKKMGYRIESEDLFSIGSIGLIKAIDTFDIDRGIKFATYAIRCIRNEIFMYYRKQKRHMYCDSLDNICSEDGKSITHLDLLESDQNVEEIVCDNNIVSLVRDRIEMFDERERTILKAFFGIGQERMFQSEIAKIYNMHQSNISKIIKACITSIKDDIGLGDEMELNLTV